MKIIFDHLHGHVINDRVFCEAFVIPENETYDDLLENGWLPNVQPPIYWYQSKSLRINYDKIKFSYKRRKILSSLSYEIFDYKSMNDEVDTFFQNYFEDKNLDMKDFYKLNSEYFKLDVMKVSIDEKVVGYTRFQTLERNLLGMETSYVSEYPRLSLGINSIILLSEYSKKIGKNSTYIYESYPEYFPYKMEIPGVEYWEGEKWI